MKSPEAIIIIYSGASGIDRIKKPSNYSLPRILLNGNAMDCNIYFFNDSPKKEQLNNVFFIPLSFWNLFKLILKIGFNKKVLVISQTDTRNYISVWLKKIFGYKLLVRRGGVYYGKETIDSDHFKRWAKKWKYYREADALLSTADGTPVKYFAKAVGVQDHRVYAWMNGFPVIPNTKGYKRSEEIVCISRLSAEKGIDYVICSFADAIPRLNEKVILRIVGDGPEEANLKNLAERLKVADRIIFEGKSNDVEKWLYSSRLLLTGLGNNTIIEAIVTSTPVICVELGEIKEMYNEFSNVYVADYPIGGYGKISDEQMPELVKQTSNYIVDILSNSISDNTTIVVDYTKYGWEARLQKEFNLYSSLVS